MPRGRYEEASSGWDEQLRCRAPDRDRSSGKARGVNATLHVFCYPPGPRRGSTAPGRPSVGPRSTTSVTFRSEKKFCEHWWAAPKQFDWSHIERPSGSMNLDGIVAA